VRTICKLALPDRWLSATCDDAPETASEKRFRNVNNGSEVPRDGEDVRRRGLVTALRDHRKLTSAQARRYAG
jgi:NADPH-dependent stearoyl-CoA 9-desaturase